MHLPVGTSIPKKYFRGDNLKVLIERFGKDPYINRTEVEFVAEMLNVQPE